MTSTKIFREKEVEQLTQYTKDEKKSRYIMNCFYRIAGRTQSELYMNNDYGYYIHNKTYIEMFEEETGRRITKLNNILSEYGLILYVSGGYPKIVKKVNECGGISVIIYGNYYR